MCVVNRYFDAFESSKLSVNKTRTVSQVTPVRNPRVQQARAATAPQPAAVSDDSDADEESEVESETGEEGGRPGFGNIRVQHPDLSSADGMCLCDLLVLSNEILYIIYISYELA